MCYSTKLSIRIIGYVIGHSVFVAVFECGDIHVSIVNTLSVLIDTPASNRTGVMLG